MQQKRGWLSIAIILAVLIIDQIVKVIVKTNMYLGEDIEIFPWFHILFVENNGMAFGMEVISKLFLSVFRIVAVIAIGYYLYKLTKNVKIKTGYIVSIAMVLAGALGNIIDSLFYGLIFNTPSGFEVATLLPEGGGYGSFLHGKVVDMLYFPLVEFNWPNWMPVVGGEYFLFFSPVFNIADSFISIGVILIVLLFREPVKKIYQQEETPNN